MNIENVTKVRDHIKALDATRFAMENYFGIRTSPKVRSPASQLNLGDLANNTNASIIEGSCNTCACIAGHTLVVLEPNARTPRDETGITARAAKLLGLSKTKAGRLFIPDFCDNWFIENTVMENVTRKQAVRVLNHLIETGEVDWSYARKAKVSS
jgi:hypothetical protein